MSNSSSDHTASDHGPLSGKSCWIVSDGKAGVETQCFAVAEELGLDIDLKRVSPRLLWDIVAPRGPVDPRERFGKPDGAFAPPWPDIAIAGGRVTVPYMRALGKHAGPATFRVFLQDPRTGPDAADLIWVPEHDRRRGANVFTTLTTPHRLTRARLAERRASMPAFIQSAPAPRVAVLLGGNSRNHTFMQDDQENLVRSLQSLAEHAGGLFITPSRRTPEPLADAVQALMSGRPGLYWDGTGDNPLHDFIAHADVLVVTADSANMVCEACASGRPVYVFHPSGGSAKFARLHHALERYGAIRPMPEKFEKLESWDYEPLSATETIAAEIETRWQNHHVKS
ncbi:MAG: mitochondrial fission ELM1 family protein [Hyphomicrobiaceae bacterium]